MEIGRETLDPGTLLNGRYMVEFVLGKGGMGAVYYARDGCGKGDPYAIKEMRVTAGDARHQQQAVYQFHQEAQFLSVLNHPNLVKVYDFFEQAGRYYLVMSYVKGKTLGEMLQGQTDFFPISLVLDWAVQLANVLTYLHSQKPPILFRDVKPSNVIVGGNGRLYLIDFGIARCFAQDGVTATFLQGVGSADYCPLEQYQGAGGTDQRSDIYSLGATLFHLLTLQPPPRAAELVEKNRQVPSPRVRNPAVSPALEDLVIKMMALRKHERYRSMDQVNEALAKVLRIQEERSERAVLPASPRKKTPNASKKKHSHKGPWVALATLTIVLLGFLVWLVFQMPAGHGP